MHIPGKILKKTVAAMRRFFYRAISDATVEGRPHKAAPVLAQGAGTVRFGDRCHAGLDYDTAFWNSYLFFNPRTKSSRIQIGDDSWIGNHFVAISEGPGIFIGCGALIGTHVEIYDTDFHTVKPSVRLSEPPKREKVIIGNDVWIGNHVIILKGTEIGDHSVIAAGAVVTGKFPGNVVIGGIPAKIIKNLNDDERTFSHG